MLQVEPAWTADERGTLLASVGGGAHSRPLRPAQVGSLLKRELDRGVSQDAIAKALFLDSTAMIGRFARLHALPPDVADAVGWGRSTTAINLTQAQEVARLPSPEDMRKLAQLILEYRLSGSEVRGAVQICLRRGVPADVGVEETVRLRPVIDRRYVQLGRFDADVTAGIKPMSQSDRDACMAQGLEQIGIATREASVREHGYALVLSEEVAAEADADAVERALNDALRKMFAARR